MMVGLTYCKSFASCHYKKDTIVLVTSGNKIHISHNKVERSEPKMNHTNQNVNIRSNKLYFCEKMIVGTITTIENNIQNVDKKIENMQHTKMTSINETIYNLNIHHVPHNVFQYIGKLLKK